MKLTAFLDMACYKEEEREKEILMVIEQVVQWVMGKELSA